MRLGVDFSQWGGALSTSTIECWKQHGVDHAVVQYSDRAPQHLATLKAAGGIDMEIYVYLYWGQSPWGQTPQERTRLALKMGEPFGIQRLWLDAEDSTHPYREDQLKECEAICAAAGVPTGIYTGRWWWVPQTRNSTAFSHLPLWHAGYLGEAANPNLSLMPKDFSRFESYGGWEQPAIWQWHNTTTFCGHSVDLNAIPESEPAEPPKERRMKDWAIVGLENELPDAYLFDGKNFFLIPGKVEQDDLKKLIYEDKIFELHLVTWQFLDRCGYKRVKVEGEK